MQQIVDIIIALGVSSWGLILLLVVVAVIVNYLKSPKGKGKGKGKVGEAMVKTAIRMRLNPATYIALHDVTVPDSRGGTTQVDHILVSYTESFNKDIILSE